MAGGIDWFRWHHGSVTDPKFQLVAKKSGARLGDVLAVWAYLLEIASAATERGRHGPIDSEAMDCMLGMDDGATAAILAAMVERDLTDGERITSWEKRQPKREREDDNSTARVKAFREKQRHETPGNANATQETPRGEESREEKKDNYGSKDPALSLGAGESAAEVFVPTPAGTVCVALKACGIWPVDPMNQRLLTLLAAGASVGEFTAFAQKAMDAAPSNAFVYLLGIVEGERTRAKATAGKLHQGALPNKQQALEARNKLVGAEWLKQQREKVQ